MTTVAKVRASVAVTLLTWLVLVIVTALGGFVGLVELSIMAVIWIVGLCYIWRP